MSGNQVKHNSKFYSRNLYFLSEKLHIKSYLFPFQGPDWDFQTKLPDWADENWMPPN